MIPIEAVLLSFLLIAAVAVCVMRRLLASIIIFTSYGIVMSVLWILLAAPDLAIAEAAVGTGISGVLFFVVLKRIQVMEKEHREEEGRRRRLGWKTGGRHVPRYSYNIFSIVACLSFTCVLLFTTSRLPPFGNPGNPTNNEVPERYIERGVQETGAVNAVASMILDYRAFDTFGETCLLFAAVCAILVLLRHDIPIGIYDVFLHEMEEPRQNIILKNMAFFLVAMIMIFGFYVILNGHLSPGGGFSGGAILGAGMALFAFAFGSASVRRFLSFKTFSVCTCAALLFYALAKGWAFFMGASGLSTGIPAGIPGNIFSGGLILPLNICVGIIVAFTVYALYALFSEGEV